MIEKKDRVVLKSIGFGTVLIKIWILAPLLLIAWLSAHFLTKVSIFWSEWWEQ